MVENLAIMGLEILQILKQSISVESSIGGCFLFFSFPLATFKYQLNECSFNKNYLTNKTGEQMFKRKDKWTEENIPDLTGKIAIVTGAKSGTGYFC